MSFAGKKSPVSICLQTDGAARGNPGPAGAGIVIKDAEGRVVREAGVYIGEATNNVAEYSGLLLGLRKAAKYQAKRLRIELDSELLVNQLNGLYKVKNAALKELFQAVSRTLSEYENVQIVHLPRARNKQADHLANEAIDRYLSGEIEEEKVLDLPNQESLF